MDRLLEKYEIDSWILKAFIVFSLLFPAYYSPYTDIYLSAYYPTFIWAYLMLVIYMALQVYRHRRHLHKPGAAGLVFVLLLLLYNIFSLYFNYKYLDWYWEQANNTVSFLFAGVLLLLNIKPDEGKHDNIKFLIHCIVTSNAASIIYYYLGYSRLLICNNQFVLYTIPETYYEERHYWIYSHKIEYAFMLTAFIALFFAYKSKFKNNVTFILSEAVLVYCLYLTHSWTGAAAAVVVAAGFFADMMVRKGFRWRMWYAAVLAALAAAAGGILYMVLKERDITTLGSRTYIWKGAIETIKEYPQGWGTRFGNSLFYITDSGAMTNNAHNVFLNQILRFSIPVGICFTLIFMVFVIYTMVRGRSFLMAGTWAALLLLMNMDYAVMSNNLAMALFIVYLVSESRREKIPENGLNKPIPVQ